MWTRKKILVLLFVEMENFLKQNIDIKAYQIEISSVPYFLGICLLHGGILYEYEIFPQVFGVGLYRF